METWLNSNPGKTLRIQGKVIACDVRNALIDSVQDFNMASEPSAKILTIENTTKISELRKALCADTQIVPFAILTLARLTLNSAGEEVPQTWTSEAQLRQALLAEVQAQGLAVSEQAIFPNRWYIKMTNQILDLPKGWLPMYLLFLGYPDGLNYGNEYFDLKIKRETRGKDWID